MNTAGGAVHRAFSWRHRSCSEHISETIYFKLSSTKCSPIEFLNETRYWSTFCAVCEVRFSNLPTEVVEFAFIAHRHTHTHTVRVEEFTRRQYQLNESLTYLFHLFHIKFTVRQHLWMKIAVSVCGGDGGLAGGLSICWIKCDLSALFGKHCIKHIKGTVWLQHQASGRLWAAIVSQHLGVNM